MGPLPPRYLGEFMQSQLLGISKPFPSQMAFSRPLSELTFSLQAARLQGNAPQLTPRAKRDRTFISVFCANLVSSTCRLSVDLTEIHLRLTHVMNRRGWATSYQVKFRLISPRWHSVSVTAQFTPLSLSYITWG